MRLWAEIYTADNTWLGLVAVAQATVTRPLDGAGQLKFDVPTTQPSALLLAYGRWVHLYTDTPTRRRIAQGRLQQQTLSISAGQKRTTWTATDALVAFQHVNTLRGLVYDDVAIQDVIRDLVSKVSGWTVTFDGVTGSTSQRFDGVSLLKALSRVADQHGLHFRLGSSANQITFGPLGTDSGVRVTNIRRADRALRTNRRVALIEKLHLTHDGFDVVNWVEPVSGPVDGALTLKNATKSSPYAVNSLTGPDGRTVYYLQDTASIASYGTIQDVISPRSLIVPVAAGSTALINASDVLYDWAASQLQRRAQPQQAYKVTAVKVGRAIRPGDTLHLAYLGEVYQRGEAVRYADIDAAFWVMKVTERYTVSGETRDFEISSVDALPVDPAALVAQVVADSAQARVAVQLNVDKREFEDEALTVGNGVPNTLDFSISATTITVSACLVTLTRAAGVDPDRISLAVDGVAVPGGPWLDGPDGGTTVTVDVADTLLGLPTLNGDHTLTVSALYNSGDLDVQLTVFEVTAGVS